MSKEIILLLAVHLSENKVFHSILGDQDIDDLLPVFIGEDFFRGNFTCLAILYLGRDRSDEIFIDSEGLLVLEIGMKTFLHTDGDELFDIFCRESFGLFD
jgi:hypothetical protein